MTSPRLKPFSDEALLEYKAEILKLLEKYPKELLTPTQVAEKLDISASFAEEILDDMAEVISLQRSHEWLYGLVVSEEVTRILEYLRTNSNELHSPDKVAKALGIEPLRSLCILGDLSGSCDKVSILWVGDNTHFYGFIEAESDRIQSFRVEVADTPQPLTPFSPVFPRE